jgi:hypothetical protein
VHLHQLQLRLEAHSSGPNAGSLESLARPDIVIETMHAHGVYLYRDTFSVILASWQKVEATDGARASIL